MSSCFSTAGPRSACLPAPSSGMCLHTHPASSSQSPAPSASTILRSRARGRCAGSLSRHDAATAARPCHSGPRRAMASEGQGPVSTQSRRSQNSRAGPAAVGAKGYRPRAASASTMPRLHMSALNEYGSPTSRSGLMYVTVPIHSVAGVSHSAAPSACDCTVPGCVQMPRSASLTCPAHVRRMLPGFTSRCTTSNTSCSISSAPATLRPTTASADGPSTSPRSTPSPRQLSRALRIASSSEPPSIYSRTIWKAPRE
mmetsp:Transcript_28827/g.58059  ORF Transcript_28827/g.58059 Transcript_28827/m.58059 type:complete len:256 (+) Transcript_28827:153-920(+)